MCSESCSIVESMKLSTKITANTDSMSKIRKPSPLLVVGTCVPQAPQHYESHNNFHTTHIVWDESQCYLNDVIVILP